MCNCFQPGLNLCKSRLQVTSHLTLCTNLRHLQEERADASWCKWLTYLLHAHTAKDTDLVSVMRLIREAEGHTEGVIVILQEAVSVLVLVQTRHRALELLQPRVQVLLDPPVTGEIGLHHLAQRQVVPCICTLRWTKNINY